MNENNITEVVKIKNVLKSRKAVLCFVAFLLILVLISLSSACGENRFSPSPSHIVLNKWKNENGRKLDIINCDIDDSLLVQTELDTIPCSQTQLIIKTENLRFSLFTKGKIIYQNTDKKLSGYGKQIHIIDIRDINKGSELCLYISPVKSRKGRIEGNILLSSRNDFLLDILCKNEKTIIVLIVLTILFISLIVIGITLLIKKKKAAPKFLYLSGCFMIIGFIILLKSELYQFIIPASFFSYILLFSCYPLLFIFIFSFILSLQKKKKAAETSAA